MKRAELKGAGKVEGADPEIERNLELLDQTIKRLLPLMKTEDLQAEIERRMKESENG